MRLPCLEHLIEQHKQGKLAGPIKGDIEMYQKVLEAQKRNLVEDKGIGADAYQRRLQEVENDIRGHLGMDKIKINYPAPETTVAQPKVQEKAAPVEPKPNQNQAGWLKWGAKTAFWLAKEAYNSLPDMSKDERAERIRQTAKMNAGTKSIKTVQKQDDEEADRKRKLR
ncbi:MAG: hypothetical protein AB7V32_08410 [Candidatus Berkiella sp.]